VNVTAIVGARPNFVKIAPILGALAQYPEVKCSLVHTGQHYDGRMSGSFFDELEIRPPDVNLGVGSGGNAAQTAEVMSRLAPVLEGNRPDLVLVVGDVNSTLAAALVAVKMAIRVAHVEAGLRSFDRTMPEEINRILVDAISDHCFTTEPAGTDNLLREGIPAERIHHVGNVMIDTLFRFRERAGLSPILSRLGLTSGAFAVLTLHRPANVDTPSALARLLHSVAQVQRDVPVVFPVHPRTRERLRQIPDVALEGAGLLAVEPLGYLDFVQLMANARCVLTDSGGIQEETTALGVPCLTLRDNTERPITITEGTNRLTGADGRGVAAAWDDLVAGRWQPGRVPELWDGRAAERIAKVIVQ
jgi:UDP-N-acetylglucosamine 2-epimerase (non-hydrolysing)